MIYFTKQPIGTTSSLLWRPSFKLEGNMQRSRNLWLHSLHRDVLLILIYIRAIPLAALQIQAGVYLVTSCRAVQRAPNQRKGQEHYGRT